MVKRSTGSSKRPRASQPVRKKKAQATGARKPTVKARKSDAREGAPRHTLQVFQIVRRMRGRRYVYPRLTLEGGALSVLGLGAGDLVAVDCDKREIRIRPLRRRAR